MKKCFLVVGLLIAISSCQSEFDKQTMQCKELIERRNELIQMNSDLNQDQIAAMELKKVNEAILRAKHLSGNNELFDLYLKKMEKEQLQKDHNELITRFP